jgi:hypothetical protein
VPPCFDEERELPLFDFSPPFFEASGELAIRAARSLDIPLSLRASYCFSFLTFALFFGMTFLPCLASSSNTPICPQHKRKKEKCLAHPGCPVPELPDEAYPKIDKCALALKAQERRDPRMVVEQRDGRLLVLGGVAASSAPDVVWDFEVGCEGCRLVVANRTSRSLG